MSRPLRIEYPGAWYHVMNRGRRREQVFFADDDHKAFLDILGKTATIFSIEIHAYVLMPNHYHLLIKTPMGNLSRAMRHINGVYTQKFNKKNKIDGSLFRGRYKSIVVEEESYLLELVRYIHRNPLQGKMEEKPGQYRWCSHGGYINDEKKENWLKTKEVLIKFSRYEKEARRKFNDYILKEVPKDLMKRIEGVNWPAILGGKDFKEKIKKMHEGKEIKIEVKEMPDYKRSIKANENMRQEIKKLVEKNRQVFNKKRKEEDVNRRRAIIYVLRTQYSLKNREIRDLVKGITESAISKHYKIAEEDVFNKKGIYSEVKALEKELKFNFKT